jgi:hypothetical protein
MSETSPNEFEQATRQPNIATELWYFLRHNKKWWLLPIVLVLLLVGLLLIASSTAMAPFIYTLF